MKIWIFLILIAFGFKVTAEEKKPYSMDFKKSGMVFYIFHDTSKPSPLMLKKPLMLYDNNGLSGEPSFIIDNEKIIDKRAKEDKNYFFKDNYSYAKRDSSIEANDGQLFHYKELPINFIRTVSKGYVLMFETEDKKSNLISVVDDKKYFFKYDSDNLIGLSASKPLEQTDNLNEVKNLVLKDPALSKIIQTFDVCVKNKDVECLIKLSPELKTAIMEWSVFKNENLCKDLTASSNSDVSVYFSKLDKMEVEWQLYKNFFKFNQKYMKASYSISASPNKEIIWLRLEGHRACDHTAILNIEFIRNLNEDWKMIVHPAYTPS